MSSPTDNCVAVLLRPVVFTRSATTFSGDASSVRAEPFAQDAQGGIIERSRADKNGEAGKKKRKKNRKRKALGGTLTVAVPNRFIS